MRPRPYDRITVESAFDNPTYETGVSILASLDTLSIIQFYAPLGGYPEGPAKPFHFSLFLGKVDYGLANIIQVSNSQQSLSFAGDERI